LNRAKTNTTVLLALLSGLLSLALPQSVLAQARLSGTTNGLPNGVPLSGPIPGQHYYAGGKNDIIPQWMLRRQIPKSLQNKIVPGRAPGDAAVTRQTVLITKADPTQQFSSTPAPSQDEHPFFSPDEKYIYFDSDRVSDTNTAENATHTFNIYRMFPDGSGIAQLLPDTINQIEPNIALDGNRVAYVSGGTISFAAGLDTSTTSGFGLYVYDISNGGAPTALTKNNASNIVFSDVRHPSWSPGGSEIAFAGQVGAGTPYHLYKVNVQTGTITQLTTGISNDTSPAWSPDSQVIAFTTNAKTFSAGGPPQGISATSLNANPAQTDIWVITQVQSTPDPRQVTNSSSIAGGKISSNKNPAWSSLNADPLGNIPTEPGNPAISENMLAFASNRADDNGDGIANDVKTTFDIYFMHASIKKDLSVQGAFTVTTPESVGNAALKLRTSTPDTAIDPNDPTSRFDPNFVSNEDNPTWPAYQNSYRIVFQSDRGATSAAPGTELNIWASTIFDINAPALLKYDIPNNEIVHVARDSAPDVAVREVSAGEKVRFRVRAVDYESGVESAYVMIKCPNSAPKSPDAKEHKIFFRDNTQYGFLDLTTQVFDLPFEADAQAIKPYDPSPSGRFRAPTNQASANTGIRNGMPSSYIGPFKIPAGLPNGWPSFNQYLAGLDDVFAFSGFSNPPDYVEDKIGLATNGQDYQNDGSYWLRLWDDGPISKGGHEPEGETAGDGVYTATWATPAALPSDWTLDVILRDRARDPFAPGSTTVGSNWKIFDNIWGFTTQPFQGSNGILYVNDYDSGQRFYQTHFGPLSNQLVAGDQTFLSKSYNGWPVESWMTEFDPALIPTRGVQGTTAERVINFLTPLGVNAYADARTQDSGTPVTGRYDIWRVLCRGPVPDSVLNSYKGHIEVQPADVIAGGTGPRSVFVAERCVFWHSPYAGDLFVGPGTIVDNDTQVRLAAFIKTGGRLFLNGEDVAWALSLGQVGATSPLLNGAFKVTFAADYLGNFPPISGTETYVGRNARGTGPIGWETWYDFFHGYLGPVPPPDDPPNLSNFYRGSELNLPKTFGALNQFSIDKITFTAPSTPDVSDFDDTWQVDGSPAITWVTDSSASPIVSKVVFAAGGFEAINPEFFIPPPGGTIILKNRRAELIHNVGDYLRTGRIFGIVRSTNGTLPLKGVFVRAVSNHTGKTVSTALTLSDGSYILDGLDATGGYAVDAALPGFLAQHLTQNFFHGGYQVRLDTFLTPAQPGSIAGTVTVLSTGAPVAGVIVQAKDKTTGGTFTATTQTDGTYIIKNVPSNTTTGYLVSVPLAANGGDLDTLGYGGSVPTSYGGPESTAKPAVVVAPSQTVTGINFALTLFPGSISGIVKHHTTVPTDPTVPTAGATVTATATVGTKVYTATTAADGTYSMPSVDPGVYKVTASAPGYALAGPITATVNSKLNTVVDFVDSALGNFALVPVPPGSVSGLVETSQGVPVPGATVAVVDANGVVLGQVTTGAVQTKTVGGANYMFNYVVTNVPAGGTVIVGARKDGYNPDPTATQTVLINSGAETTGINFTIDPLNTFQSGTFSDGTPILSLASAPYEYSGVASSNVATLFGVPAADVSGKAFFFSTWLTDTASYVLFPTPPADTFHLGRGYFIADSNGNTSLALTIKGTPAEQTTSPDPTHQGYNSIDGSFRIALKPGWNLIGEPFPYPVNFLNLKVVGADGTVSDVLTAQSGTNPSLGAALWTYTAGNYQVAYTLDPYRGYWIRAFDNRPAASQTSGAVITLVVSPSARQDRSVKDTRGVLLAGNRQTDGWMLNMVASVGDHKSAPTTVGQTRAAVDTYDRYKLEAPPAVSKKDVTMVVEHPEWTTKSGLYSVDVRSANTLTQKWAFTVTSTQANTPVTLNWPNLAQVPRQKDLILTDLDSKQVMDLRGHSSYTITGGATGVVRHFQLDSRPAQRNTLQLSSVAVQVNPRRSAGQPGSVNISYNTTADATVQVGITKNGRVIRSVESGSRLAGVSQVVWDMKDNQGVTVPSDTYSVEVRAQDSQGHTIRQIVPLIISR
jgi:hypothetical protein